MLPVTHVQGAVTELHAAPAGRIVFVDSHEDSRELYLDYFAYVGVGATAVPKAGDALRLVSRWTPDVVVTCLRLPDMDGFALCDALRTMPHTRHVPVIAVSTCLADHERALHDPRFAAVLMKPFFLNMLLDSVRAALARSNVQHA